MAASITVVIHTHNEEKNIQECIDSARLLTKEIHIIDMDSTDRTQDIVKKNGIKIFNFPFTTYVEPARKFGIKQSKSDWVFILDADERMTPELAEEIKEKVLQQKINQYRLAAIGYLAKIYLEENNGSNMEDGGLTIKYD